MNRPSHLATKKWVILVLALCLVASSLSWFITDLIRLRNGGPFDPANRPPLPPLRHTSGEKIGPRLQGIIEPWMTFEYINTTYNLPNNYLKDRLHIVNKKYPSVTVRKQSELENIPLPEFTEKVSTYVRTYITEQNAQ
jgi:hypothetical protein